MPNSPNRSVVIISGLLTLLFLGGVTTAIAFRNGWVSVAGAPATAVADVGQGDIAAYRAQLEEAYRALDDAYAQVRSLQTAQAQLASRGGESEAREHDDRSDRRSRRRMSDDD